MRTFLAIILLCFPRLGFAAELTALLDPAGALWKTSPETFLAAHGNDGFRWVSDQKESARSTNPELTFLDHRVYETIVGFAAGKPDSLTMSLYNRGDAGDLRAAQFEKLLTDLNQQLVKWTSEKGVPLPDESRNNVITVRRRAWVKAPHAIEMIWSFTEKSRGQGTDAVRPEYVRLKITPFDPNRDPRKLRFARSESKTSKPVNALELKARAKRRPGGDVIIDSVPMVDQGQKGYCACAVAERLLRYYGRAIDQHEVAQIANSDASTGTNPDQMVSALRKIGNELGLAIHVNNDFDLADFKKLISDYNRLARRETGKFEIQLGHQIDLGEVYQALDPQLFAEARGKRSGVRQNFYDNIKRTINAGVPLAWTVYLGKIEEQPPVPGFGGHMRLITGYNDANQEILYTDTWGKGHEEKRMSLENAWAITLGLYTMYPPAVKL